MSDHLVELCRCPFCPPGRGVVAVDPRSLRFRPERTDFLAFAPDRAPAGPCAHLVQFGASARWEGWCGGSDSREFRSRRDALMDSEFDHAVGNFLWWVRSRRPSRSGARRGCAEGRVPDRPHRPGWEWFAAPDALFAADPGRLVEECLKRGLRLR